jgi:DNA-binding transcriptional ArsR family regulator
MTFDNLQCKLRWVLWKFIQKTGEDKPDKVPFPVHAYQKAEISLGRPAASPLLDDLQPPPRTPAGAVFVSFGDSSSSDDECVYSNIIILIVPDSLRQFKAEIFQALAHPTRIGILDLLREGELTVGTFVERLELEQANLSQHLAILRAKQLVTARKAGNQVFYSVRDPLIWKVLDLMLRYFQLQVGESMAMLEKMAKTQERK